MAAIGFVGGDPTKVSKAGDTMTGALLLPGDPTSALQAADKAYVDSVTSAGVADATATTKGKLQLAGDLSGTASVPTVPGLASKVPMSRTITAGTGLSGGGDLTADRTLSAVDATAVAKGVVQLTGDLGGTAASPTVPGLAGKVSTGRQILTGAGLSGGGDLSADRTISATDATTGAKGIVQLAGDLGGTAAAPTVPGLAGKVGTARQVLAGTGLTGGGDLSADRTLAVSFGTTAGTAAQGNDSRIAGAVQASTATTKGDLLVATGAGTLVRVGVGSDTQVLTADSSQAAGVKWAAAAGGGASGQDNVFPLSAYGLVGASGDPDEFQNQSGVASNTVFMARVWIPAGNAISKLAAAVRAAGTYSTSSTPNQIAIYDDTGAQLGITADDNTLWSSAGWAVRTITTIPSQGTGRWVYIGYIVGGYTGLSMPFPMGANDLNAPWLGQNINNTGNRRAFYLSASSLPASFNPGSAGTNTGYVPLVGAA